MERTLAPKMKVRFASLGAMLAAGVALWTDLFGVDVSGDVDKVLKILVIGAGALYSGWQKKETVI